MADARCAGSRFRPNGSRSGRGRRAACSTVSCGRGNLRRRFPAHARSHARKPGTSGETCADYPTCGAELVDDPELLLEALELALGLGLWDAFELCEGLGLCDALELCDALGLDDELELCDALELPPADGEVDALELELAGADGPDLPPPPLGRPAPDVALL